MEPLPSNSEELSYTALKAEYAALKAEYTTLTTKHAALTVEHAARGIACSKSIVDPSTALASSGLSQPESTVPAACDIADFLPLEEHISSATTIEEVKLSVDERLAVMDAGGIGRMMVSWHSDLLWMNASSGGVANVPLNRYNSSDIPSALTNMRFANERMVDYVALSSGRLKGASVHDAYGYVYVYGHYPAAD